MLPAISCSRRRRCCCCCCRCRCRCCWRCRCCCYHYYYSRRRRCCQDRWRAHLGAPINLRASAASITRRPASCVRNSQQVTGRLWAKKNKRNVYFGQLDWRAPRNNIGPTTSPLGRAQRLVGRAGSGPSEAAGARNNYRPRGRIVAAAAPVVAPPLCVCTFEFVAASALFVAARSYISAQVRPGVRKLGVGGGGGGG